jgi:hypothetical protein
MGWDINGADFKLADLVTRLATVRGIHWNDEDTDAAMFCLGLFSEPEPDTGQTGVLGGAHDLYLGGGGAKVEMVLVGCAGDYVVGWPTVPLPLASITCTGTIATATTSVPHGLAVGKTFNGRVSGATPSGYNAGSIASPVVLTAASVDTFTYRVGSTLAAATVPGVYQADTYVAKPHHLRYSYGQYVSGAAGTLSGVYTSTGANGTLWTLSYEAQSGDLTGWNDVRTKAALRPADPDYPTSETETVAPEWLVGDVFYAERYTDGVTNGYNTASPPALVPVLDANGNQLVWIASPDSSRNWTDFD